MKANTALKTKAASVAKQSNQPKSIKDLIKVMQPEIAKALPSVITPERFTRICLSALSSNPKLQECSANSFLGAMMNAAQLGVEPNTPLGQAYLIPYRNHNKMECQFQLGYKGLLDLAHRTGEYKSITAEVVHENDNFEYELGLEPKLKHVPAMSNRGKVIAYYAVYRLTNGGEAFVVMSVEDVEKHAKKYSKSFSNGPWKSDFDAMAKKTVLKQLLKYAPLKADLAKGVTEDGSVKSSISDDMSLVEDEVDYIDVTPAEPEEEAEAVDVDPETGEVLMDGMTNAEVDAMLAAEE